MSIDKWLSDKDSKEEKVRREKAFKRLSEDEVKDLKKKKIRNMIQEERQKSSELSRNDEFLTQIIEFKNWLNQRTYLKGDLDRIETWISNLYSTIKDEADKEKNSIDKDEKKKLIENYKNISPKFLDEKTRIAINKKIYGTKRTNSDNYYLRKLRNTIKEKLYEAKYYEILDKLLKI
ncbi:MAG: hypothetical protein ACFFBV_06875 [Promethearchaeota archaeon]